MNRKPRKIPFRKYFDILYEYLMNQKFSFILLTYARKTAETQLNELSAHNLGYAFPGSKNSSADVCPAARSSCV